jgi:hypothetical protein
MSEETVTLINRSRTAHVIVLDHPAFRDKKWGYRVSNAVVIDDSATGLRSERSVRRALPGSLTLMPGARIEGLPPAIAQVTQVAALLEARQIAIETPNAKDSEPPQDDRQRATLDGERVPQPRKKPEARG